MYIITCYVHKHLLCTQEQVIGVGYDELPGHLTALEGVFTVCPIVLRANIIRSENDRNNWCPLLTLNEMTSNRIQRFVIKKNIRRSAIGL